MRIWDLEPEKLCRQHLLGEHRELHALWTILTEGKQGYFRHPETLRWKRKLKALYNRHQAQVNEMTARGYNHHSPLDEALAAGSGKQDDFVNTLEEQVLLLCKKGCECKV